jgi:GNAT superfamily N-acetyltransferase
VTRFAVDDPELTGEALNALYTVVGWNEDGERTSAKTGLVLERAACFVAAWDKDTLVGFGRVLADVYSAQILDVMTHPAYRRRGVASGMVSRLVTFAEAEGFSLMLIAASGVEDLYKQFGFVAANPASDVLMYRPLP